MRLGTILKSAAAVALTATMVFAQPKPKSQKEVDALMAIQNAADPGARIAAVDSLLQKFADTEFKGYALMVAAASAQQMNDFEKMVIYAERTLEADPKNFQAMLMLAGGIAQRTREHDLDREDKLARVDKLANQAMEIAKTSPKPNPQITDEQWEGSLRWCARSTMLRLRTGRRRWRRHRARIRPPWCGWRTPTISRASLMKPSLC
jgi:hypothetical protein